MQLKSTPDYVRMQPRGEGDNGTEQLQKGKTEVSKLNQNDLVLPLVAEFPVANISRNGTKADIIVNIP